MRAWSPEYAVVAVLTLIVLILAAPTLLAKREQARLMMKENQMKQLGTSLHNYHDTFQRFPAGPSAAKKPAAREPDPEPLLISPL